MNIEEIWKPIIDYEELYLVSNFGNVMSYNKKILKQCNRGNYKAVTLIKNKIKKLCNVHRLVAIAFIENPENLPQVNHKDENKLNNNVNNLEWCTSKYNINYGNRTELSSSKQRKSVCCMDSIGNVIQTFIGINDTKNYGFAQQAVSECCRGLRKRHKGFEWRFL